MNLEAYGLRNTLLCFLLNTIGDSLAFWVGLAELLTQDEILYDCAVMDLSSLVIWSCGKYLLRKRVVYTPVGIIQNLDRRVVKQ